MKAGCRIALLISGALLTSSWTIPAQATELKLLPSNPPKKVATVRAAASPRPSIGVRPRAFEVASIEALPNSHAVPLILGVTY